MANAPLDSDYSLTGVWGQPHAPEPDTHDYPTLAEALRQFLDAVAAAKPDTDTQRELTHTLRAWTEALTGHAVHEPERLFGRQMHVAGRAQTMAPLFVATAGDRDSVRGTAVFGRYFLGGNGAAHGGAVSLLFDEVMGRLQRTMGRPMGRTAYLHVDYRAITPIDKPLDVAAWFVSEEGRKRLIRAEIRDGETVCATAEGLFITLRPGQP